jgi:hypothetical protein
MSTNLDQIAGYLTNRSLKFTRDDGRGILVVPFKRPDNEPLLVFIRVENEGRFLKIFAPKLLTYQRGPHKPKLLETLLLTCWESKMLQWEYDPSDGEIRPMVEFPIEDAFLTERQFMRAFEGLVQLVNTYFPRLQKVIETGQDPGQSTGDHPATDRLADAFRRFMRDHDGPGGGDAPDAL